MREITEGAHDTDGFADRHAVEDDFELAPRRLVVIPMEPDRGLPDALDQIEYVGAFLIAHSIAEDASEQPDIRPQPGILFRCQGFGGAIGPEFGVRRHDLGGHDWWLQKPRPSSSRNFRSPAQDQEKGGAALKSFALPAPNEDRAAGA